MTSALRFRIERGPYSRVSPQSHGKYVVKDSMRSDANNVRGAFDDMGDAETFKEALERIDNE